MEPEQGSDRVKIWFRFVPREGWLPYGKEGLWADRVSEDTARLVNVPFLQDGVAEGEVVRFTTDHDGLHWAVERVEASGNCTVRIVPILAGPLGPSARAVHEKLAPFGLGGEAFSQEVPAGRPDGPRGRRPCWNQGLADRRAGERLVALRGLLRHRCMERCVESRCRWA